MAKKGWTIRYRPWEIVYTEEFKTKWGLSSDKIRHSALKELASENEELRSYIEAGIKENYDE